MEPGNKLANTIWGDIYPVQGTGWSGWVRERKVGARDPTFFEKSGGGKRSRNGQISVEK